MKKLTTLVITITLLGLILAIPSNASTPADDDAPIIVYVPLTSEDNWNEPVHDDWNKSEDDWDEPEDDWDEPDFPRDDPEDDWNKSEDDWDDPDFPRDDPEDDKITYPYTTLAIFIVCVCFLAYGLYLIKGNKEADAEEADAEEAAAEEADAEEADAEEADAEN